MERAIGRAREKLADQESLSDGLAKVLRTMADQSKTYLQRLPVRAHKRIFVLDIDQITSLRIDRGLVYATAAEGEFWTKYTTFGQLEDHLDPDVFLRVHRQSIVNLNHIREVEAYDNNIARLTLTSGHHVNVSRSQMKLLRQVLDL